MGRGIFYSNAVLKLLQCSVELSIHFLFSFVSNTCSMCLKRTFAIRNITYLT